MRLLVPALPIARSIALPIAMLGALLLALSASADSPVLSNRCVDDPSLCRDGGLAPGAVRERPVSALDRADGSIVLTNRDLELSTDELTNRTAPPAPEPVDVAAHATPPAPEAPEAAAGEAAGEAGPEAATAAGTVAPSGGSEFTADEGGGTARIAPGVDFSACMERSIRAGNAFDESRRVCSAVFPE